MEHNPISSGDIAMSGLSHMEAEHRLLRARIDTLEDQVKELREELRLWSNHIAKGVNELADFVGYPEP